MAPNLAELGDWRSVATTQAVFNLRGDNGQATGGLAVDTSLGWKGPESDPIPGSPQFLHVHD